MVRSRPRPVSAMSRGKPFVLNPAPSRSAAKAHLREPVRDSRERARSQGYQSGQEDIPGAIREVACIGV